MAYASVYHVVAHHPARPTYTATSVPNASFVAMMVDEAGAELDFALVAGGWDSPLLSSAPSSVKAFFQRANAYGAISMIEPGAQVGHNRGTFYEMWQAAKKMIESGQLPGMERNEGEAGVRSRRDPQSSASGPFFAFDMWL